MELPFDREAAERSLVSVVNAQGICQGMGVVVAGGDYVVTAVHVVRAVVGDQQEPHVLDNGPFALIRAFGERNVSQRAVMESIFFEPHSDVAVLEGTTESVCLGESEGFGGAVEFWELERSEAVIHTAPLARGTKHELFYCSHKGEWRRMVGLVSRIGDRGIAYDSGETPESGTSGSPVFTADGRVLGVVWGGSNDVKYLSAALPSWLLCRIVRAQAAQEGGE